MESQFIKHLQFGLSQALYSVVGWTIGWGIGFGAMDAVPRIQQTRTDIETIIVYGFCFALSGLIIGLSQWLILRRVTASAEWWVVANTVVLPVGIILGNSAANITGFGMLWGATAGIIIGVMTGSMLIWFRQQENEVV